MRIMIHSNAPWTFTGYGQQVRELLPRLQSLGHQMAVIANFGLSGAVLHWRDVPTYPLREQRQNADVLGVYCQHFGADVIVSLYDVWALPPNYRELAGVPWVAMTPVDGAPLNEEMVKRLRTTDYIIAYSRFGQTEIERAGFQCSYVPHGIDTQNIYVPGDKIQARASLGIPPEAYLVTVVAANKGFPARKAWPELMAAFKLFHDAHPNSILYCHTTKRPYGSGGEGIYFDPLRKVLGVPGNAIAFPDQGALAIGVPDDEMARIYQASDVLLLPSMGEGFGLPVIEAQACGCPVITQRCSATAETTHNGISIEPMQPMWLPQLGYFWQTPSIMSIAAALEEVYLWDDAKREAGARAGRDAICAQYDYDVVWSKYWVPFLNTMEETLW